MTQMEVYKMEGIKDLPVAVRLPFGKAWFAEYNGDFAEAARLLEDAIAAENRRLSES